MPSSLQSPAPSILDRVMAILLNPHEEWPRIAAENATSRDIFWRYVLPLAVVGPVCGIIGSQVFGFTIFGISVSQGPGSALVGGVVAAVLALASFMVLTLIADFLAPRFGGRHSHERAFQLVAYASTAAWLAGVFQVYPPLGVLGVLALYSIYLIHAGAGPVMGVPRDKALGYTAAILVCGLALNLAVAGLMAANIRILGSMGLIGNAAAESDDPGGPFAAPDGSTANPADPAAMGNLEAMRRAAEDAASGKRPPVPPARLQALLPASIGAYARTGTESTGIGVGSNAQGTYEDGNGHRITLKITDVSALGAIAGIGTVLGVEQNREDASGYEKTGTVDGRMQTEAWNSESGYGRFGTILAGRFMVEADGNAVSVDELKSAVATMDGGELERLAK